MCTCVTHMEPYLATKAFHQTVKSMSMKITTAEKQVLRYKVV